MDPVDRLRNAEIGYWLKVTLHAFYMHVPCMGVLRFCFLLLSNVNSLFWSISPQDAVTQGGFLVDIVDDDILITGSPLAGRCTATHCIVVPSASCTCQAANLTEIESEQSARNILKSCMTRDYMFSHFCRISDSKIDCVSG